MLEIICAKYEKNPSRTVRAVAQTRPDVPYCSSFIAKSWLNDLQDIGQGQRSLCATYPLMLVIICAWYGKNPFRTVAVTGQTPHVGRMDGCMHGDTDGWTNGWSETKYPPTTSLCRGYNNLYSELYSKQNTLANRPIYTTVKHITPYCILSVN